MAQNLEIVWPHELALGASMGTTLRAMKAAAESQALSHRPFE